MSYEEYLNNEIELINSYFLYQFFKHAAHISDCDIDKMDKYLEDLNPYLLRSPVIDYFLITTDFYNPTLLDGVKYTHGKDAWNMKRQRQYQIYLRPVLSARLLINPRVSRASPASHLCAAYHARPVNGLHSALNTLWKVRLLYVSPGHMIILNLNKFI